MTATAAYIDMDRPPMVEAGDWYLVDGMAMKVVDNNGRDWVACLPDLNDLRTTKHVLRSVLLASRKIVTNHEGAT